MNNRRRLWMVSLWIFLAASWIASASGEDFAWRIDRIEADRWNHRYVGDILDRLPGIWVRDLGLVGQVAPFRYGGANPNQSVLCVDGQPLAEPWTGATDLNWIPTEMIERVEIYPASNPFVLSPVGGVINLVTRQIQSKRPTTTFLYRSAGNGFGDLDINFSQSVFSRFTLSAGIATKKFGEEIPGVAYKGQTLRAQVTYQILERLHLRYMVMDETHEGDMPYTLTLPDLSVLQYPERKIAFNDHRVTMESSYLNLASTLFLNFSSARYKFKSSTSSVTSETPVDFFTINWTEDAHPVGLPLRIGYRFSKNSLTPADREKIETTEQTAFLRLDPKFGKFEPCADLEAIRFRSETIRLAASLGASSRLTEKWTVGLSVSRRLRFPSLGETSGFLLVAGPVETLSEYQYLDSDTTVLPNQDLKPEEAEEIDVHLDWKPLPSLGATVRFFLRDTENLIQFQPDTDSPRFVNLGKAKFQGVELLLRTGPFYNFELLGVFNYLRAVDGDENFLMERPNVWGSGSLAWSHPFFEDDLKVHLECAVRYRSEFWTLVEDQPALAGNSGMLLDLKAACTVMKQADVFLEYDNLLNTDLVRVHGFPLTGRTFRYGIRWTVFD